MSTLREYVSNLRASFSDDNSSTNSSCPSTPAQWCVNDTDGTPMCILKPTLIPTCILALLIGLLCSKRIAQFPGKFPSRYYYRLAFFLYGIMMTSAGILHCFIGDQVSLSTILADTDDDSGGFFYLLISVIDVGLTSNIAVTILFCGLCDIKFFDPKKTGTRVLLFLIYFLIFFFWTLGLLNQWEWVFNVLYFGVVAVSCAIYLLTQLCLKTNRRALALLFVAGLYGALGILATSFGAERICDSEGPFWSLYIGPEFIWFLFSDIAMAFVFAYVIRVNQENRIEMRTYHIDLEKHPMKH